MDPRVQKIIETSAGEARLTSRYLPSGAGHDAQHKARNSPAGMIFIPSKDGISHAPQEFSTPGDITNGANMLLRTVLALDAASWTA
jgi:N-carbamoyl-L-amino-acid hydrolase